MLVLSKRKGSASLDPCSGTHNKMRLLTHNTMRNNTKEANGKGFPLRITAVEVRVVENPDATNVGDDEVAFVRHILPTLEWSALVQVRISRLPMDTLCNLDPYLTERRPQNRLVLV